MIKNAGILPYCFKNNKIKVMLVHLGGGGEKSWSILNGIIKDEGNILKEAKNNFTNETGLDIPNVKFINLLHIKYNQSLLYVWAINYNFKANWFSISEARQKIIQYQAPFLIKLIINLEKLKEEKLND